jgi:hypothetical protein
MTTSNVDALAVTIRKLIEALIGRDQGLIGAHERATEAQANLRDVLMSALEDGAAKSETSR